MAGCYSTIGSAYSLLDRLFPPLIADDTPTPVSTPSVLGVEPTTVTDNIQTTETPCVWTGNPERCFPKRAYFSDNPKYLPYMNTCYAALTKESCEMKPCEKDTQIRSEDSLLCVEKPENFASCEQSNCDDPLIATLCRLTCLGKGDQTK
jgi:hypothetical protein